MAAPDNISYIDWKPYGPSAGALAAFMSIGVRDEDSQDVIGVYTIQLPPGYERSIEEVVPECTLAKITDSWEGAINIVGLGRPTEDKMVKPLACFAGHSPQSFLTLLDRHMAEGYPFGDRATQVPDPYGMVKANAADAICLVAFTVKYLLEQGHTIQDIQKPDAALYAKFLNYMKTQIDFLGASGQVKFSGNDKPHYLAVQQVQQGKIVDVGSVSPEDTEDKLQWINGGADGTMWQAEPAEPPPPDNFPYMVIQLGAPLLICCSPTIVGFFKGWAQAGRELATA
jgi:hypothetical protein